MAANFSHIIMHGTALRQGGVARETGDEGQGGSGRGRVTRFSANGYVSLHPRRLRWASNSHPPHRVSASKCRGGEVPAATHEGN